MQAEILLLDKNIARLRQDGCHLPGHMQTVASTLSRSRRAVLDADMVIGAVLVPGAKAPTLVSNELVSRMKPGSVLVDIAIDQGGCFEDSRPTRTTTRRTGSTTRCSTASRTCRCRSTPPRTRSAT